MTDEEIRSEAEAILMSAYEHAELVNFIDREGFLLCVSSRLKIVGRAVRREAVEEAAKLLDEREAAYSKEAQRFANTQEGTDNNMYWRADGASDVLEQCAFELRRLVSSSRGESV